MTDAVSVITVVALAPVVAVFVLVVAAFCLLLTGALFFEGIVIPWWWIAYWLSDKQIKRPPSERYLRYGYHDVCCGYVGTKRCCREAEK